MMRRTLLAVVVAQVGCFDPDDGVAEGTTDPGTDIGTMSGTLWASTSGSTSISSPDTSASTTSSASNESTGDVAESSGSTAPQEGESSGSSTGCDTTCAGPTVVAVEPEDLETLLFSLAPLTITFSEPIDPSTVTTSTVRLTRSDQALPGNVEASGTTAVFTPRVPWALAARYTLRLSSDISSAEGQPVAEHSRELTLPDGTWESELLDERTGTPAIAVAPAGDHAALLTVLSSDVPPEVFATRFSLDDGWSELEQLSDAGGTAYPGGPSVDINDDGEIAAVWEYYDAIQEASYAPSTGWSEVGSLDGSGYEPEVFLSPTGAADCVFRANHESWQITRIRYSIPRGGSTASILSDVLHDAEAPAAAATDANGLAVVWIQDDRVWGHRSGAPATPLSDPEVIASEPEVAVDEGQGTAVAAWVQPGTDATEIWVARSVSAAATGTAERLSDGTAASSEPTIAIDALGRAIVSWRQRRGTSTHLYAASYVVGSGWTEGALISEGLTEEVSGAALALDPGGNGYALWRQAAVAGDPANEIWGARFLADDGWQAPRRIHEGESGVTTPALDIDAVGRVVAGFGGEGLWVARFE